MTHNKDELRTRLLNQVESALYYLFPNGKRRGARFVVGNVQGDAGESLVIEIEGAKSGVWFDFATGESGDVLALWAAVRGFTLPGQFGELLDDL
ncbi:MAG: topoisomerase, partial [Deltaproteobacteria bacterium]